MYKIKNLNSLKKLSKIFKSNEKNTEKLYCKNKRAQSCKYK